MKPQQHELAQEPGDLVREVLVYVIGDGDDEDAPPPDDDS